MFKLTRLKVLLHLLCPSVEFLRKSLVNFIFSEPYIVINICEKDQKMQRILINLFQLNYPLHVSNK